MAALIESFFGDDFAGGVPGSYFIEQGGKARGKEECNPFESGLAGRRVCLVPDMPNGQLDMDHLKSLTEQSGAKVTTRGIRENPNRSNPTYLCVLFSNHAADIGQNPDGGKVRRLNVLRLRNRFGPRADEDTAQEVGDIKDRVKTTPYRQDFFWAVAPFYQLLKLYGTNIVRSPHVQEDTELCLLVEGADGVEQQVGADDPDQEFIKKTFKAVAVCDAAKATEVKQKMQGHWKIKAKELPTRMQTVGFVLSDGYVCDGKRYVCFKFDGGAAKPVGLKR